MTTNPYFANEGFPSEQTLYEDIIIEALQIYGHEFQYIPRDTVNIDKLLGEDIASKFTTTYNIEMYVENIEGYEGQELFQKFGVEIRDEGTLVVARRRWNTEVGIPHNLIRPREGDLIYIPFSKALFEITFVEHEEPFYQLNNLPVYKLRVSMFEYNDEDIDVTVPGLDTSKIEGNTMSIRLTLDSSAIAFIIGENVTQTLPNGNISGEISAINGNDINIVHITSNDSTYKQFIIGTNIVSDTSNLTRNVISVIEEDTDGFSHNVDIQTEAANIIDFSESNPFGNY